MVYESEKGDKKQLYFFRIRSDTTALIRQGRGGNSSEILIPAIVASQVNNLISREFPVDESSEAVLGVGYEGESLMIQVLQELKVKFVVAFVAILLTVVGIAAWLWRRLRRERERRLASESARRFLAEGREKERKRLAREIHDGPVQDLHGLHLHLARKQANGSNGVEEELMRVTRELRAMSANLHPPALERFGLPAALRSHARRLREHNDAPEIDIQAEVGEESLSEDLRLALFRIAQEAMSNAAQHAAPDRISVEVKCEESTVSLRVVDDGQGFDVPETLDAKAADGHYGLLGMKERADSVDAALTIRSDPETGTEVEVVASHHAPEEMATVA